MTTRAESWPAILGVGLIAVALTACGTSGSHLAPSGSTTSLMVGWERYFTLGWTVDPERGGGRRLRGYVSNRYGQFATNVRVLGQALDRSGAVVGQGIEWVPEGVAGGGRTYFEVPHLPPADLYRVTVWEYTWMQSDGDRR